MAAHRAYWTQMFLEGTGNKMLTAIFDIVSVRRRIPDTDSLMV